MAPKRKLGIAGYLGMVIAIFLPLFGVILAVLFLISLAAIVF